MFSDAELAYAAGIIDGEGCIGAYNTRTKTDTRAAHYQICVRVAMKDPEPIEWLYQRWPYSKLIQPSKGPGKPGPYFVWNARNRQSEEFLAAIRPFLVLKGPQADMALEFARLRRSQRDSHPRKERYTPEMLAERESYVAQLKALKRVHHESAWSDSLTA